MNKNRFFVFVIFCFALQYSFGANFNVLNGISVNPSEFHNELNISGDGTVVVGRNGSLAAKWENGTVTNLDSVTGARITLPFGVSKDGSVVVGESIFSTSYQAFRWENGVSYNLGTLSGSSSYAYDVSADGSVVVGRSSSVWPNEAFRWENGVMTGLGDLSGGSQYSFAEAVSADGSVVIGKSVSSKGLEAFRWESGVMVGLGDLPGGGFYSHALNISADGSVIVGYGETWNNAIEAAYWNNGVISGLGDLPGGSHYSYALAVSGDGAVIVGTGTSESGEEAFIWNQADGMLSLKELLVNTYGLDLENWKLTCAYDISDDGQTIVGGGYDPYGNPQGWIVTIPEPATVVLLALGGLALRRRRK